MIENIYVFFAILMEREACLNRWWKISKYHFRDFLVTLSFSEIRLTDKLTTFLIIPYIVYFLAFEQTIPFIDRYNVTRWSNRKEKGKSKFDLHVHDKGMIDLFQYGDLVPYVFHLFQSDHVHHRENLQG